MLIAYIISGLHFALCRFIFLSDIIFLLKTLLLTFFTVQVCWSADGIFFELFKVSSGSSKGGVHSVLLSVGHCQQFLIFLSL